MAVVSFQLMASGSLNAGESTSVPWNNAPSERVYAFSVEPKGVPDGDIVPTTLTFEITRVTYQLLPGGKRRVVVVVKNTSPMNWGYNLYITRIKA